MVMICGDGGESDGGDGEIETLPMMVTVVIVTVILMSRWGC